VGQSRLLIGLGVATAIVTTLELSPYWHALQAGLASLGFDPGRAALICAWIGAFGIALLAGVFTARPWPSAVAATSYLGLTYAAPWVWHAIQVRPYLFASPERLDPGGLLRNLAGMLAVGFVVSVLAAAAGRLLSELVSRPAALPGPSAPVRALLFVVLTTAFVFSALSADPLLRYGPSHHLYVPASAAAGAVSGQVLVRTVHSQARQSDVAMAVYLPPGYRRAAQTRYPVVYLLHGHPGSYRDWLNMGIARISDVGIAGGSIAEAIVVIPDGNGNTQRPAQWADSRDGLDRVESSMLELVLLIDHDYRTLADRRHRVVAGLSEGGFGAANLASRHPDLFGVAISLSGYFRAEGLAFGQDRAYMRANSPASIVRDQASARTVRFILVAGESDAPYLRNAESFATELDRWAVPHTLVRLPGGHESSVWTNGLVVGLEQVKPQLRERAQ
jgi:enterochelin esterase-like enzyme